MSDDKPAPLPNDDENLGEFTEMSTDEWSPTWTDEVFDLLQQGLDAARGSALRAAQNNDASEWARATQSVGTYMASVDKVGQAFGQHAMQLEADGSPFLQALMGMFSELTNQGVHVHTIPVD